MKGHPVFAQDMNMKKNGTWFVWSSGQGCARSWTRATKDWDLQTKASWQKKDQPLPEAEVSLAYTEVTSAIRALSVCWFSLLLPVAVTQFTAPGWCSHRWFSKLLAEYQRAYLTLVSAGPTRAITGNCLSFFCKAQSCFQCLQWASGRSTAFIPFPLVPQEHSVNMYLAESMKTDKC